MDESIKFFVPASPKATVSSPCSSAPACVTSWTSAAVATTVCTRPDPASTPMWAFMPNVALVHMWRPAAMRLIARGLPLHNV